MELNLDPGIQNWTFNAWRRSVGDGDETTPRKTWSGCGILNLGPASVVVQESKLRGLRCRRKAPVGNAILVAQTEADLFQRI